jgi:hypothetical protein
MSKKMFFSLREAARHIGVPVPTIRHHQYYTNQINGSVFGRTMVYSRKQLDDYAKNGRTDIQIDRSEWFDLSQAAEHVAPHRLTLSDIKKAIYDHDALPVERVSNVVIVSRQALEQWAHRAQQKGQPPNGEQARQLFSQHHVDAYLPDLPLATFRYDQTRGRIKPLHKDGLKLFSREQLDDYVQNGRYTEVELRPEAVNNLAEAAAYLGLTEAEVMDRVYTLRDLRGDEIRGKLFFLTGELDRFRQT